MWFVGQTANVIIYERKKLGLRKILKALAFYIFEGRRRGRRKKKGKIFFHPCNFFCIDILLPFQSVAILKV